jgi:hypothetical protein
MTKKHLPGSEFRAWLRSRSVWFWAITGTVCSILVLLAGTQIAVNSGEAVEWYTGFGA